jgi:hypothetical protein
MSLTLEQIVSRLDDPETPVVWLDPATPEEIWEGLPGGLRARGMRVIDLDLSQPVATLEELLQRFAAEGTMDPAPATLQELRTRLITLTASSEAGWVVIFRHPEEFRQSDESVFEDFLEVLEAVHDRLNEAHTGVLRLIVRD